jgi:asparagine synthase (glutamine-hydrolysing)
MCGISGIVNFKYKKNAHAFTERVKAMNESMAHRGPDDSGHVNFDNGKVIFGHRRLSIVDVSKSGKQPMMDSSNRFVITFNGEIYNYRNWSRKVINLEIILTLRFCLMPSPSGEKIV